MLMEVVWGGDYDDYSNMDNSWSDWDRWVIPWNSDQVLREALKFAVAWKKGIGKIQQWVFENYWGEGDYKNVRAKALFNIYLNEKGKTQ